MQSSCVGQWLQQVANAGLNTINQFINGTSHLTSFSNNSNSPLQIRHYILNHKERALINPNSIEEKHLPTKEHVSHKYKRLINESCQNTGYIQEKLELLSVIITDNVSEELCNPCHKGISSPLVNCGENLIGNFKSNFLIHLLLSPHIIKNIKYRNMS